MSENKKHHLNDAKEKGQNEILLEQQFALLDSMYKCLSQGIIIYNIKGDVISVNRKGMELFGMRNLDEALGVNIFDEPNTTEKTKECLRRGEDVEYEVDYDFDLVFRTGFLKTSRRGIRTFGVKATMIRDKENYPTGYLEAYEDITEKRATEKVLEQKHLLLQTIYDNLPVGIEVYDEEGKLIEINDHEMEAMGIHSREDILGLDFFANPNVTDEVKEKCRRGETVELLAEYDFTKVKDYYRTSLDGSKYLSATLTSINGYNALHTRKMGYLVVNQDVTRRVMRERLLKESKAKMKLSIENSNIVHWDFDVKRKSFTAYNEPMNDYDDSNELTQKDYQRAIHPDDIYKEEEVMKLMLEGRDEEFSLDVRFRTSDQEDWAYVTINGIPFKKDDTGRVIYYTGFRKDNTRWMKITEELKLANVELQKAKERAEQSDKLKSAFLANMSHEIRTPLNAIVGFSSLLIETDDEEEKAEYIRLISTNNDLLLRLISDILDLSKVEAGIVDFRKERMDVSLYFNKVAMSLRQRLTNPKVQFIVENPYACCWGTFDQNRIAQVLTNFVTNAIKYTTKGSITVGYEYVNHGLKFYVKDTGIGISDEKKSRVFHRFEKLDEFAQGTGLGLAITKAITEIDGGKVGFESQEGVGSTFWAWKPCEDIEVVERTITGNVLTIENN